ncbi:extracellular solute-binding protein [Paenibacillus pasadenensis]|uniref:extracellular solute-binding protein n=1 Tax=Paenibacillus TaxID=44249 RepID=UPI00040663E3|nr:MULTISPECIES: extracellular solute-binding protein [Paenibacillus]QGG56975.1 extracellular solute-binding protein [Paenibacillus sp. B01]
MKKWTTIAWTAALAVAVTACSSNSGSPAANEGNAGAAPDGSGQPVTLKIVYKDEGTANAASVKFFGELEKALAKDEGLNVKFELVDLAQGSYAENLNLLLLGGTIPDIIYFQGGDQQMADQGLLEDLTPYIEKSEHVKAIMEPHNKTRMDSYPYLLWIKPLAPKVPVVRADWFEALDSSKALTDNPTVDNYYAFFKELVEKKPASGKPNYALTAAGDIAEINTIFNAAFGLDQTWIKKDDGTFEYARISEGEKEKLAFYHKLYQEGLLDPQFITKQWDTKEDAFYKGEAGVITGTAGKIIDLYNGRMQDLGGESAKLVVLPPAKGVGQGFGATDVTKESRGLAISSQSSHKDAAFQVFDYLASPKGQMLDRLGYEGENYAVVDIKIELNENYYNNWYARFWEPVDIKSEIPLQTPLLGEPGAKSLELASTFYTEDNAFIIPEQFVANWDAMNNLYKEYSTDFITGKKDLSQFGAFVDAWNAAGGAEITAYANETIQ